MDEQLDNELRDRIRQVFDNNEDTTADEGWLLLREKFPEKTSRRPIAWYRWAAAALILLFIGIGWWAYNLKPGHQQFSALPERHTRSPQYAIRKKTAGNNNRSQTNVTIQTKPLVPAVNNNKLLAQHNSVAETSLQQPEVNKPASGGARADQTPVHEPPEDILSANKPANSFPLSQTGQVQVVKSFRILTAEQAGEEKNELAVLAMIKRDQANELKKQPAPEKDKAKVLLGVYTATYVNYSKGSDDQFNVGAGLAADIRLSRNFRLSTGLAVDQNTLNYATTPPSVAAAGNFNSLAAKNIFVAAAAYSFGPSASNIISPNLKNLNASLIGIDVPVNIKYLINPAKTDAYFAAGLSSGTFANETYSYKYNYSSIFNSQSQEVSTRSSFGNFYFASMVNLAFGVGYPVGKINRLIIEPFLKYPIGGLGEQQIRFGSGGINLKFNFQSSKK